MHFNEFFFFWGGGGGGWDWFIHQFDTCITVINFMMSNPKSCLYKKNTQFYHNEKCTMWKIILLFGCFFPPFFFGGGGGLLLFYCFVFIGCN